MERFGACTTFGSKISPVAVGRLCLPAKMGDKRISSLNFVTLLPAKMKDLRSHTLMHARLELKIK
jgi:hypothetical protein